MIRPARLGPVRAGRAGPSTGAARNVRAGQGRFGPVLFKPMQLQRNIKISCRAALGPVSIQGEWWNGIGGGIDTPFRGGLSLPPDHARPGFVLSYQWVDVQNRAEPTSFGFDGLAMVKLLWADRKAGRDLLAMVQRRIVRGRSVGGRQSVRLVRENASKGFWVLPAMIRTRVIRTPLLWSVGVKL